MIDKSLTTQLYVALGLLVALAPLALRLVAPARAVPGWVWSALVAAAMAWAGWHSLHATPGSWLPLGALAAAAVGVVVVQRAFRWQAVLGVALGLAVTVSLIWWRRASAQAPALNPYEALAFVALAVAAAWGLRRIVPDPEAPSPGASRGGLLFAVYLLLCAALGANTFLAHSPTAWHHWTAYVGPAELMLSGAHLLSDVPAQYGLGPTALLAATCGSDCFRALYPLVVALNLALSGVVGIAALKLVGSRSRWTQVTVLALSLVCTQLWMALPADLVHPLIYPSVAGIRFLPVLALAAVCVSAGLAGKGAPRWGDALWALGVLWSPESAFYVTIVWWPVSLAFAADAPGDWRVALRAMVVAGLKRLRALAVLVVAFLAVYALAYRALPTVNGLLAYALYPPGPLPINPSGVLLYLLAMLALALGQLAVQWSDPRAAPGRVAHFAVLLLALGTSSYFALGRSHDNNVANLSGAFLLLALSVYARAPRLEWRAAGLAVTVSYLAWATAFGYGQWKSAWAQGRFWVLRPGEAIGAFSFGHPATMGTLRATWGGQLTDPEQIQRTLDRLAAAQPGAVELLTVTYDLPRTAPPSHAWTGLHSIGNYLFMPTRLRREFIDRTAQRLGRCGWLVLDTLYQTPPGGGSPSAAEWLEDFKGSYAIEAQQLEGTLLLVYLRPKQVATCPGAY
jgi:hypothetical protein